MHQTGPHNNAVARIRRSAAPATVHHAGLIYEETRKQQGKREMSNKSQLTRRAFVGNAAAATAFTIVPQRVLGQSAPSNLVNVAVVGSGGHGAFVITQMLKAGGVNVVALCDVDAEFASHIETMEYGDRHITGLYR